MIEELKYAGVWWLPEDRVSGTLRFTSDEGAILDLIGSFKDIKDIDKVQSAEFILGLSSDGKNITLYKCVETGSRFSFPGIQTSSFYASVVGSLFACRIQVEARANHSLSRFEKNFKKLDLVILDELGYVPFSRDAGQLLFSMVSARYELGSFIVTSNLDFSRWTEIFGDEGMTAALIDRLVHRGYVFTTSGDSYRFKESLRMAREA